MLGERFHISQLRDPSQKCFIESVFDLSKNNLQTHPLFVDFVDEDEPVFIIQRVFTPDGRNKIKINGQNITLNQLKDIGNHLVDFHGSHDHQLLLSSETHISMLDQLVDFGELIETYGNKYQEYQHLLKKLETLQTLSTNREREMDLLSHQIKELEQVPLDEASYETIQQEQVKLNNAEKLIGYVNPKTQRAVMQVADASESPILETGLYNLTEDETSVRLHFSNGQTQDWTLIQLEDED